MPFSPIEEIIEDIKRGKMVIVCDDEDRENEGDLTMAAELGHRRRHQLHGRPRAGSDLPSDGGRDRGPPRHPGDGHP